MSAPEQRTIEVIVGLQRLKTIMERNGISSIIPMIGSIEDRENNHLVQTYQEVTKTILRLEDTFNVSAAELRDADDQKNPFTVYVVHGDGGERSRGPEVGYFSQRKSALEFSKGKGWYSICRALTCSQNNHRKQRRLTRNRPPTIGKNTPYNPERHPMDLNSRDYLRKFFEQHHNEYLKFDLVENKTSNRADLHAFMLLDRLVPSSDDIVAASEHDEIFLDIDCSELIKAATEWQLIELIRCGVRYDSRRESVICLRNVRKHSWIRSIISMVFHNIHQSATLI